MILQVDIKLFFSIDKVRRIETNMYLLVEKVLLKEAFERSPRMKSMQNWKSTRSVTLLLIFAHEMPVTKTESWIISS